MKLFLVVLYAGIMYELAPVISPAAIVIINVVALMAVSALVILRHAN